LKKVLFTDLDGTLLDLYSYSCEQVRDSVNKLQEADISIVFCSSKTWAEQAYYLDELELKEPAIVENGSGIFFPEKSALASLISTKTIRLHDRQVLPLGQTYGKVLKALQEASAQHYPNLKFYANQSVEEISAITKLDFEGAQKARSRDFSETIFNADAASVDYARFKNAVESTGFQCIPGSKYITITDNRSDKGRAVKSLLRLYKRRYGKVISYGAGDSLNDLPMLKVVDFPYLVQKPDKSWVDCKVNKISKVNGIGPLGWNMLAKEILI